MQGKGCVNEQVTVVNDLYSVPPGIARKTSWRQLRVVPWLGEEAGDIGHRLPSLITG